MHTTSGTQEASTLPRTQIHEVVVTHFEVICCWANTCALSRASWSTRPLIVRCQAQHNVRFLKLRTK
jgi:hypothetical protein